MRPLSPRRDHAGSATKVWRYTSRHKSRRVRHAAGRNLWAGSPDLAQILMALCLSRRSAGGAGRFIPFWRVSQWPLYGPMND
jgi:hypothetical protein